MLFLNYFDLVQWSTENIKTLIFLLIKVKGSIYDSNPHGTECIGDVTKLPTATDSNLYESLNRRSNI